MSAPLVLLTGATGFVGRHLLVELDKRGIQSRLVIRTGTKDRLVTNEANEIVEVDDLFAQPTDWYADICSGASHVLHAAWIARPGYYLTAPENLDCLIGTLALARGAAASKVEKLLGVGTCFEYDLSEGTLGTDTPLNPTTPYASAKVAAYQALSHWLPSQGVKFAWGRLFYLFGAGEHPDRLVPYLHRKLAAGESAELTSGRQERDFLDVADGARMLVDGLLGGLTGPFNVCSGKAMTIRHLAEQIADQYGAANRLVFGARPDNLVDPPRVVGIPGQQ